MQYTAEKIEEQNLMYRITTTNNGEEITFNVICANDESEIEGLVEYHLNFINDPQPVVPQEPVQPTKEELMAKLLEIQAQLERFKS
jgi:hypothetical protein